jgi:predicted O-linked N-acetylglucosamine transferase (SPINDLY family)
MDNDENSTKLVDYDSSSHDSTLINDEKESPIMNKEILLRTMAQMKKNIIDHYDFVQSQIDLRTEELLMNLPDALDEGRKQLLETIEEEKVKCLTALSQDSQFIKLRNEYAAQFKHLKKQYNTTEDVEMAQQIQEKLIDLKKKVTILCEFVEDFKNRTLCFQEADESMYSSLIGELITEDEHTTISNKTKDNL